MAVATSTQWSEVFRETFPGFAASDIIAKTAVTIGTQADWQCVPVATSAQEPLGIVRDDQDAGHSVAVYDGPGSVIRVIAGATVAQGQNIGVGAATSSIHPVSGLGATYCLFAPVSGASGSVVYRVGTALEEANPGQKFALRVNPKQLSGLV